MKIARSVDELGAGDRAVALGTFDGVHVGHRRVLQATVAAGHTSTVVTFAPHPRTALGDPVELLTTFERRLELLAETGIDETVVVSFTPDFARLQPDEFVDSVLRPIGTRVVVAGTTFRFGHRRGGDLAALERLGLEVRPVPLVEGVSATAIRQLLKTGDVRRAAALLGRPAAIDGVVVAGDARGGTLGFPTANVRVDPELLTPAYGIYAGAALGHRAAVSVGTNPHYGGQEQRIEAFLLEFEGDLYGRRIVVELWDRLRDEQAFATEAELVGQIAADVEATRRATRPGDDAAGT